MRRGLTLIVLGALALGCGEGREKLIAQLQSPRSEERAAAVRHLGEQNRPEDLVFFTRAAQDLSAYVREEAATALGKSQDPRVVDLLGALLEDSDEDVQAKAAMALAQFKSEKAKQYLTSQYARRGRSTRYAIVQALKASNVPGAMATVVVAESKAIWERDLHALAEGSLAEQAAAAEELGKSGRAEALGKLEALARQAQVNVAAAATRGLGFSGDHREVANVALLLKESNPELREASISALRGLGDPAALDQLTAVALERSAASDAATRAIAALPSSDAANQDLCQIALEGADAQAFEAGRAMRDRGGCPVAPFLKKLPSLKHRGALSGAALDNALEALRAVAGLGPTAKDALPQVLALLGDPGDPVRTRALDAAAAIGDATAAAAIAKAFSAERDRANALRADWVTQPLPQRYAEGFSPSERSLAVAPQEEADAKKLNKLLNDVDRDRVAHAEEKGTVLKQARPPSEIVDDATDAELAPLGAAMQALAAVGADGALQTLLPYANDPSAALRLSTLSALALLGKPGIDAARAGLLDPDREVQAGIATALTTDGADGIAALLDAVAHQNGDRVALLMSLQDQTLPATAMPELIVLLRGGGPESVIAAHLLGKMRAKDAVEPLKKVLADPTAPAQREALWALGEIGDRGSAPAVGKDLYSESPEIRAAAAQALAKIGGPGQIEALDALKGDYYRTVRAAAEAALARLSTPVAETSK